MGAGAMQGQACGSSSSSSSDNECHQSASNNISKSSSSRGSGSTTGGPTVGRKAAQATAAAAEASGGNSYAATVFQLQTKCWMQLAADLTFPSAWCHWHCQLPLLLHWQSSPRNVLGRGL